MAEGLDAVMGLPDISYIDRMTLADCQQFLITKYQEHYKDITGKDITLQKASPRRIELLSVAELMYYALQCVDKAGKMNSLKYAYGDYLEHIGAFKNVARSAAKRAQVPVRFTLSQARESAVGIDKGVTVTADQKVFFEVTEYAEIPAGETETTLVLTCTEAGEAGNKYAPGEINILCDPAGFIESVANTEESGGGEAQMSDDALREKIYLAPSGYSVGGPDDAWVTMAKNYSAEVSDVEVWSGEDSVVNICVMLKDGKIPGNDFLAPLAEYLSAPDRKPTADYIKVQPPAAVDYHIEAVYYIAEGNKTAAGAIQAEVQQAVSDYVCWQGAHGGGIGTQDPAAKARVGRDINPDELTARCKKAGAKRIVISSPAYTPIEKHEIASLSLNGEGQPDIRLEYGGIESD